MPSSDDDQLETLKREIGKAKGQEMPASGAGGDVSRAMRLGVEMMAGVAVGGVLGHFLDRWLNTAPWLFIACFFLGAAAGYRNLLRAAKISESDN